HLLGLSPDREHLLAVLVDRDDRGLVHDDSAPLGVDQGIGSSQVDSQVAGKKSKNRSQIRPFASAGSFWAAEARARPRSDQRATSTLLREISFARYMAASAFLMRPSAVTACSGQFATPMLTVSRIFSLCPENSYSSTRFRMRSAISSAPASGVS